ncbi:MAG: anti-sigma factor, partial [Deltaproteobacteria bacterium]|nr:anti-sigma factor [Deltaproteobacteria bacterium]
MIKNLLRTTALASSLVVFAGCTASDAPVGDDDTTPDSTDLELEAGLAQGKADGATGAVAAGPGRVQLYGAVARQLYNLMDDASATASVFAGYRLLRGPRTACISDGLATYCELAGATDDDPAAGFAAGFHGNRTTSAASYLLRLLRAETESTADDVSAPWFRCVRSARVWCGVEEAREIELDFTALPALAAGSVYEGWLIQDGATTTDRFTGGSHIRQFAPASLAGATAYVLTIEPRRGDPRAPSSTHILAASLAGGQGALSTQHPAALGTDFATAAARYVLATPSSAAMDDNDRGIWFLDPAGTEALVVPTLPAGWSYEGWV